MTLGQPAGGMPVGGLGLRPQVAVPLLGDEGRQQAVAQAEELSEETARSTVSIRWPSRAGTVHEVPQGIELLLGP